MRSTDGSKICIPLVRRGDAAQRCIGFEARYLQVESPDAIAKLLKNSAKTSRRRKSSPYQSTMSMLIFYINRGGKTLSASRRRTLERAKTSLRRIFYRDPRHRTGTGRGGTRVQILRVEHSDTPATRHVSRNLTKSVRDRPIRSIPGSSTFWASAPRIASDNAVSPGCRSRPFLVDAGRSIIATSGRTSECHFGHAAARSF
jgi:hypothetical protein